MTTKEKLEFFKNKGYSINEKDEIISPKNKVLTFRPYIIAIINGEKIKIDVNTDQFVYYMKTGELLEIKVGRKKDVVNYDNLTLIEKLEVFKNKGFFLKDGFIYSNIHNKIKDMKNVRTGKIFVRYEILKHYLETGEVLNLEKYHHLVKKEKVKKERIRKEKPKKEKPQKKIVIVETPKEIKKIKNIDHIELTYEIIISKGKGKLTGKAELMLIKLADNLIKKFIYNSTDDMYDCKMNGICAMFEGWRNFNEYKYDNAFPYFTEICKRGIAAGLNILTAKNYSGKPILFSLNEINKY